MGRAVLTERESITSAVDTGTGLGGEREVLKAGAVVSQGWK